MVDRDQLNLWIDAYLDGYMTPEEMASFDAMLRSSPDVRAEFLDHLRRHHALVESMSQAGAVASDPPILMAEKIEPAIEQIQVARPASTRRPVAAPQEAPSRFRFRAIPTE